LQLRSTKKSGERGNNEVNAVSDRLGEIRIGAELLAEADEDKGLDQLVEMTFHGRPSLAKASSVVFAQSSNIETSVKTA
jgi:hypothetical protein